jgi:response regulator RpfG family c-di-GMP phosphodiesterase
VAFLQMAIDITLHHHERYDGTGYPHRLAGVALPAHEEPPVALRHRRAPV